MSGLLRLTAAVVILGAAAFAAAFGYAWYRLHADLSRRPLGPRAAPSEPFEDIVLRSADGTVIAGWYVPAPSPKGAVVIVHGLDGSKSGMLRYAESLRSAGWASVIVDLRAHGGSGGERVRLGTEEWQDAEAAFDHARGRKELSGKPVGFLGESMGAATVLIAAGRTGKGDFVIARVPYSDFRSLFEARAEEGLFGRIPGSGSMLRAAARLELGGERLAVEPIAAMGDIRAPVFLIWAEDDEVIGNGHGERLHAASRTTTETWAAAGGHDLRDEDFDEFIARVLAFLDGAAAD
jgi:alpha-beta hydrolase superfamily lysophospholipase